MRASPIGRGTHALACGGIAGAFSLFLAHINQGPTDLRQVLFAGRALLRGMDPYPLIGPAGAFPWGNAFYYPLPAALLIAPVAFLPEALAEALFMAGSVGLLAYGLERDGVHRLALLLAAPVGVAIQVAQWTMLLSAAALVPSLAFVWIAKPNFALPFLLSRTSRRALVSFGLGSALLCLVAVAIVPTWPAEWLRAVRGATHMRPPVLAPFVGPLLLVGLLRWKDPDIRLILATACIPQTAGLYNAVPILLAARNRGEVRWLVAWSWIAATAERLAMDRLAGESEYDVVCAISVLLLYLPAVWMVLRRAGRPSRATAEHIRPAALAADRPVVILAP